MADGAAVVSGPPPVGGLDASFDRLIRALPETAFGAPDDAFIDPAFSRDPFTPLAALREGAGPIVLRGGDGRYAGADIFNVWGHDLTRPHAVALSFAAVEEIGRDHGRFLSQGAYGAQLEAHGETLNALDGVDHMLRRRLFDRTMFGRGAMDQWLDALTRPVATYLVERLEQKLRRGEGGELCRDLALPITYKSMATIIGVPQEHFAEFVVLGEKAQSGPRDMEGAVRAILQLDGFFAEELEKRRGCPAHDMLSILANESERGWQMEADEVIRHCRFLLPGGIETTWRQTANLMYALMTHPTQYRAVVEEPALAEQAIEEAIRWMPSGFVVPRRAGEATEVQGVALPAGTLICGIQGIANRDPSRWDEPDRFDIFRERKDHLTFHTGKHYCMGQHLVRNTLRTLMGLLIERLPEMKLAVPASDIETRGFGVRCPTHVPVTL